MSTDGQARILTKEEKIENAQKYFLITFSNYFKSSSILLENRTTSYRILVNEMISIYDEINKAKNEVEKSRLNKAFRYLLEEFKDCLENNPIFKLNMWNKEFTQIHNMLLYFIKLTSSSKASKQENYKDYGKVEEELLYKMVTSLRSLLKKIDAKQFVKGHFNLILSQEEPLSFDQIDIIVHSLFNELLCVHSATFLRRGIDALLQPSKADSIHEQIIKYSDKFLSNKFSMQSYEFLVRLVVSDEINSDMRLESEAILIDRDKFQKMKIETKNINFLDHLFPSSKNTYLLLQKITAADDYKVSELLEDNVSRFVEVYQLHSVKKEMIRGNKGLVNINKQGWHLADLFISDRAVAIKKTEREQEDIKSFITLRNSRLGKNETGNDLFLLERAYSLININGSMTPENQLLNAWLALEHIVAPYNKEAIIEKIRQIIPKVVSLYYIKQKMNEAWLELNLFTTQSEYLAQFITECKKEENWKYKKLEFANKLRVENEVNKLITAVDHDISLKRRLMELNGLLCFPKQRKAKITAVHQTITNDFNRIYRIRNKIVHSGTNIPDTIAIITSRLIDYNQRLLGTIVHYMNKSNEIALEEVLNSIVETYNWYTQEEIQDIEEIITPNYLYI